MKDRKNKRSRARRKDLKREGGGNRISHKDDGDMGVELGVPLWRFLSATRRLNA